MRNPRRTINVPKAMQIKRKSPTPRLKSLSLWWARHMWFEKRHSVQTSLWYFKSSFTVGKVTLYFPMYRFSYLTISVLNPDWTYSPETIHFLFSLKGSDFVSRKFFGNATKLFLCVADISLIVDTQQLIKFESKENLKKKKILTFRYLLIYVWRWHRKIDRIKFPKRL